MIFPQALGVLRGRLDLSHVVSDDPYSRHRALAIRRPTTDLSGDYTCLVSSFQAEDKRKKTLVVYGMSKRTLYETRSSFF